jgi:hypothetical protein
LPENIEVDISALETIESMITVADLKVASDKVEVVTSPEQVIVKVEEPRAEEEVVAPTEGEETVVAPAMNQKTEEEKAADEAEKAKDKED